MPKQSKTQIRNELAFQKLHRLERKHLQRDLTAKLRQLLLKTNATHKWLGEKLGVNSSLIGRVMSSEAEGLPSVETLDRLIVEAEKLQKVAI